jgi:Ca2+-transporting ATPase
MDTFAAIALCSEPPRPGLMDLPPKRRDENILTPSMVKTILTTAGFFIVVMMTLLLLMKGTPGDPARGIEEHRGLWAGSGPWSSEFPQFTVRQVSLFFTTYVLFQVWNAINCRSLVPDVSGLSGLFRNPVFLAILSTIVVVQVIIVTFGGAIFKVGPLGLEDWAAIAVGTASVLLFAEVARRVRLLLRSK